MSSRREPTRACRTLAWLLYRDAPIELEPNAPLLVTVPESLDEIGADWSELARAGLARAFGDDEPEYGPKDVQCR